MFEECPPTMQYVLSATMLQGPYLMLTVDTSASHPRVDVRPLDWTDALDKTRAPALSRTLNDLHPDVVLGADLVRCSLPLVTLH